MRNLRAKCLVAIVILLGIASSAQTLQREQSPLIQRLHKLQRRGVMFGHQDDTFYGLGWKWQQHRSDVLETCGDYPAVLGFELGGLEQEHNRNLDSVPFDMMRREMLAHLDRGGIVTVSWHPRNPLTGGNAWDVTSTQAVTSILSGGANHAMFTQWMNRVAEFLKSVSPDGSSIIFRPWHENNGSWFWWGKDLCTQEEYLSLWSMMQDHLIGSGLRRMVWSYSPNLDGSMTMDDFLSRYPGDDRVDLIGIDAYQNGTAQEFTRDVDANLTMLQRYCKSHRKLLALTECGYRSTPDPQWWTATLLPLVKRFKLSYALTWRNENLTECFGPWPQGVSAPDFKRFYQHKRTLFLNDISNR